MMCFPRAAAWSLKGHRGHMGHSAGYPPRLAFPAIASSCVRHDSPGRSSFRLSRPCVRCPLQPRSHLCVGTMLKLSVALRWGVGQEVLTEDERQWCVRAVEVIHALRRELASMPGGMLNAG
jgi:hypothetical protein